MSRPVLLLLLLWSTRATAHPTSDGAGSGGYQVQFPAPHTTIPPTLAEVAVSMELRLQDLEAALSAKAYAALFRGARDLRVLAVALPEKATDLPGPSQATVGAASQAIQSQIQTFLVAAGDGEVEAATAALAAARGELDLVKALAPGAEEARDRADVDGP